VHDDVDFLVREDLSDGRFVAQIHIVELHGWSDRAAVAENQVVQNNRPMPSSNQLPNAMTSDVTSSTNDENIHAGQACIASGRVLARPFVSL
jgi:hypothetical protein